MSGKIDNTKFYHILGLSKESTPDEIKKQYKKKAMLHHPDKNPNDKEKNEKIFKDISHAYEVLKDPQKRKIYDEYGEEGLEGMGGRQGNPFDIFENLFGGRGGGFGGFGGGGFGGGPSSRRGKDRIEEIPIELEDLYNNVIKKIEIKQKVSCLDCKGLGAEKSSFIKKCTGCDGKGRVMRIVQMGHMIQQTTSICHKCEGKGTFIDPRGLCKYCSGEKVVIKKKIINLPIEKDFKNNKKITIPEMAHHNPDVDIQGDLIMVIKILDHPRFKKDKYNLIYEKNILLSESLCGLKFKLYQLDERELKVQMNDIIRPNEEYIVRNEGFYKNNDERGDLIIKFNIIFPENLSKERKTYLYKILPVKNDEEKFSKNAELKIIESLGEHINMEEINLDEKVNNGEYGDDSEGVECVQQ